MGVTCPIQTRAEAASDEHHLGLLSRIGQGDRVALRELYTHYHQPLLRFMARITREPELAQEGVNDVMLIVWQRSVSFRRRSKVSTWLMGIAYHRALRLLERSSRWSRRFKAADFDDSLEQQTPDLGAHFAEYLETRDLIDHGLRRLSPEQRAVVELTYFGGYSYEEIAKIIGCAENTVKTRMFYARAKLRSLLPALGKDEASAADSPEMHAALAPKGRVDELREGASILR
jgi:RNA polymerase sigma-70 factor, ECF subfamily